VFPVDGLDLFATTAVRRTFVTGGLAGDEVDVDRSVAELAANAGVTWRSPWRVDLSAAGHYRSETEWGLRDFDPATLGIVVTPESVAPRLLVSARLAARPFPEEDLEVGVVVWNPLAFAGDPYPEHPEGPAAVRPGVRPARVEVLMWWWSALAACAWDPPRDPGAPPWDNALAGEVVVTAPGPASEAWITLFAAADLGPPFGTGEPVTFTTVPRGDFTGGGATLLAADWALTAVPDGAWSVAALVDRDHDFHPLLGPLAGATCGDVVGAHVVGADVPVPAPLEVSGGELVDDIAVLAATELPIERPVFSLVVGSVSREAFAGPLPPAIRLAAASIGTSFGEDLPLALGPTCEPLADCAGDGGLPVCAGALRHGAVGWSWWTRTWTAPRDPYPAPEQAAAGLLDVWPRVYLSLETGEGRYVAEAAPLLAELAVAVAQGLPPSAVAPVGALFPAAELSVTVLPSFRRYHEDGGDGEDAKGPYDVITNPAAVPDGPWTVTVVSRTGQTWSVPNEAAAGAGAGPGVRAGGAGAWG
jgi:hypothetical protein